MNLESDEPALLHVPNALEVKKDVARPTYLVIHAMSHTETFTEKELRV